MHFLDDHSEVENESSNPDSETDAHDLDSVDDATRPNDDAPDFIVPLDDSGVWEPNEDSAASGPVFKATADVLGLTIFAFVIAMRIMMIAMMAGYALTALALLLLGTARVVSHWFTGDWEQILLGIVSISLLLLTAFFCWRSRSIVLDDWRDRAWKGVETFIKTLFFSVHAALCVLLIAVMAGFFLFGIGALAIHLAQNW